MSLRTPDLSAEIAVASIDLFPWDIPGRPSWGSDLEHLESYLAETGCRNFEIHPTEALRVDIAKRYLSYQQGHVDVMEIVNRLVGSQHVRFAIPGIVGKIINLNGKRRTPDAIRSLEHIYEIQSVLPRPIPTVMYAEVPPKDVRDLDNNPEPDDSPHQQDQSSPKPYAIIQPFAELYRGDVRNNEDLLRAMARLGIIGLCPDTVHARRRAADGNKPPRIADTWADQFASGRVFQMHVGADRFDTGLIDPDIAATSVREFKAFTSRQWQNALHTEMGDMIVAAIENWVPPSELSQEIGRPILRLVIEIPPRPRSILHRIKEHAHFATTLANIVQAAGATPLLWEDAA